MSLNNDIYEESRPSRINVGNLDRKYDEIQLLFHDCLEAYNEPLIFRTRVSILIQALRNFTFALQKNKSSIPNFDRWYEKWQNHMTNDIYMRWLHRKRNEIVKEDLIIGDSVAIVKYYFDHTIKKTEAYDIDESTDSVIQDCMNMVSDNPGLSHAVGALQRIYVVDINGKPEGIMSILNGGIIFINLIYIDLKGHLDGKAIISEARIKQVSELSQFDIRPLEIIFKFKDGTRVSGDFYDNLIEESIIPIGTKEAKPLVGSLRKLESDDKHKLTRRLFNNSKDILIKKGFVNPLVLLHFPDKGWYVMEAFFNDRPEKMTYMRNLARFIDLNDIDEVVSVSEAWTAKDRNIDDICKRIGSGKDLATLRNKGESLLLQYINKKGQALSRIAAFKEAENGTKQFEDARLIKGSDPLSMALYYPIFEVWGLVKK